MKRLTSFPFVVAVVLAAGISVQAQNKNAASAISPEKLALIREYISLTGQDSQQMADNMYETQMTEAKAMISRMLDSDRSFTAAEKAAFKVSSEESFDRTAKLFKEFFATELKLDTMMEEVAVPIFDRNFSETELRELIAFYRSPTGKKTLSIAPELMKDTLAYTFEKIMPKLEAFMKKTVDSEVSLIKQQVRPTGTKRKVVKKS